MRNETFLPLKTLHPVEQNQLFGVSDTTGYKKSIPEVKIGRGSPNCKKMCLQIVEEIQNNVPPCKTVKFDISSSTVHNMIKRFKEYGEIYIHKLQSQRSIMDTSNLQASGGTALKTGMILSLKSLHPCL